MSEHTSVRMSIHTTHVDVHVSRHAWPTAPRPAPITQLRRTGAEKSSNMRVYMCVDMYVDMCVGMCVDMRAAMCVDMCVDMCVGMCVGMCVEMYVDM